MLSRALILLCTFTAMLLGTSPAARANCLVQPVQSALSPSGKFKATLSVNGVLKLWRLDAKSKKFVAKTGGKLEARGHHVSLFVPDSGDRVVVFDVWEGVGVYRTNGSEIRYHAGSSLLTPEELESAPDKWTCHPAGAFFDSMSLGRDGTAQVKLHNGRKVVFRLRDGGIVGGSAVTQP